MIKMLGVICILTGTVLTGHYFAEKSLVRIYILEELEQALQYMYGEIEYAAEDITEIFSDLALRSRYCGDFWLGMCDRLRERSGCDLYNIWTVGLNGCRWTKYLLYEDRLLLDEVGKNTGNLDRQSQLHTLEIFKNRLAGIIADAKRVYKDKARVCHAVGAVAGIFISVLLI